MVEPPPAQGLLFRAGLEDAVFEAPRLASEVRIAAGGLVSRVTLRQHFINSSDALTPGGPLRYVVPAAG